MTSEPAARVTVRYWAGARAAAGVAEEDVHAATLAEALTAVTTAHGEGLRPVLAVCSFVVNDQPVGKTDPLVVALAEGDVVEVLPPFAGGAAA